jgi:hypothetical protein
MPAKAGIQYAAAFNLIMNDCDYWVPAFAGTTVEEKLTPS